MISLQEPPTREPTQKPTRKPKKTTTTERWEPEVEEDFNYAPILKNDISRINVKVGDTLEYKV